MIAGVEFLVQYLMAVSRESVKGGKSVVEIVVLIDIVVAEYHTNTLITMMGSVTGTDWLMN